METRRPAMASATLSDASAPALRRRSQGRRTLLALALVCVLPVLASYLAFYVWQPAGRVNFGVLLSPLPLGAETLPGVAGQPEFSADELRGRWTLVLAAPAACPSACVDALYRMRQTRLAQGKEMERVARLWLVSDDGRPGTALLAEHAGLRVARASGAWLQSLPEANAGRIFLVDPRGQVMMRFPDAVDATEDTRGMMRDLQRLLKYSALGRGEGQ